jgi:CRP-like cAMP-binding protein
MAIDTIAGHLAQLEAFRGLDAERLERIAREADRILYRDGQVIAEPGQDGDGAVLVVGGEAWAEAPEAPEARMAVAAGALIGEMAMLTEHAFAMRVVARGDVRAVKISREALLELMQADRVLLEHFEARLVERLSRMALELRMIDERLAAATAIAARAA